MKRLAWTLLLTVALLLGGQACGSSGESELDPFGAQADTN